MVTILLYLNDWQPGDGGELRLFGTKQVDADVGTGPGLRDAASAPDLERFVDVAPLSGRVVTGGRRLQTLLWPQLALQVCARLNQHGFIRFTSGDVSVKGDLACCPRATGAALGHDLVGDGRLKGRCNLCGSERCCEVYTGVFFFPGVSGTTTCAALTRSNHLRTIPDWFGLGPWAKHIVPYQGWVWKPNGALEL